MNNLTPFSPAEVKYWSEMAHPQLPLARAIVTILARDAAIQFLVSQLSEARASRDRAIEASNADLERRRKAEREHDQVTVEVS